MMIQTIQMTKNGMPMSEIIQGYWRMTDWQMTPQQRMSFLKQHVELGITSVDHADIYGNYSCEQLFGEALALEPAIREHIQIITKCDIMLLSDRFPARRVKYYDTSAAHIIASAEASLKNLQTDYIDLLLIHRPDPLMDADEVAGAFQKLKSSGKVRHFGVSNFTPAQFDLLQSRLNEPLITNQIEVNPINISALHDGTLEHLQKLRVRPMIWSALAGGSIFNAESAQAQRLRAVLTEVAGEVGAQGIDQLIYAWILKLPSKPLPIIGSGQIERVKTTVDACKLILTREQWFRIWQASTGHEVP
jgi:predicted oxidoreductase